MIKINLLNSKIGFVPSLNRHVPGTKKCATCSNFKELSEFWKSSRSRDGIESRCKECLSKKHLRYCEGNRNSAVEIPAEKKCGRCGIIRIAKFFTVDRRSHDHLDHRCRFCKRTLNKQNGTGRNNVARFLNGKYGLTQADYDKMLLDQEGKCAICSSVFNQSGRGTRGQVDHDHATGKVRSLLCNRCNGKLGAIEDAVFRERAMAYLERHS